ncbi:nickel-binding accessory protein UreJ-HupE [Geminocystis sp. NIES-3709]|nr:nickel-binding accessory protein UreJ-HupE [Geminocystis sp. NIES-3709]
MLGDYLMKNYIKLGSKLIYSLPIGLLFLATPAFAHHAMGNVTPNNFFTGFVSGLAHPVIGLDHLAFIIGVGLLGSLSPWGMIIPIGFVFTSILGTAIHLMSIDLPVTELIVALSVLISGLMLAKGNLPKTPSIMVLALIAGIFHGYAYGESIIGAETTPLISYLAGFSIVQTIISFIAYRLGKLSIRKSADQKNPSSSLILRLTGCVICGIGITFISQFLGV